MALTFKSNKTTFDVTSTTTGITISGSQKSWTIASTSSVTTFNLTIKNTGSSNARIDDIVLSVTTAGGDTPQPTTYTVTYDANGGSGTMTDSDSPYAAGATVTVLGNEFTRTDYEFDHWNTAADDSGTSYDEGDTFTINANTTLYAQWTENTTPSGETATLNIQAYAEANNWVNQTQYTTATVSPVTFTANGGGNTGKYYTNGQDWRFYQSESASITITIPDGYTLVSVKPTYTVSNGGVLKNGNTTIASGTTVSVSGTSVTFTVGNSGSATNGQVKFTNIDVTYVSNGGTVPPSITANNVEIAYDATSGSFNYTINNPVQGGYLTVDENESWISDPMADNGVVIFNTETNPNTVSREGIIRMRYLYDGEILTHNVTITQTAAPVTYTTIPALFEAATDTETSVLVTFNNWVVSGVSTNGNNVFVTDNNGNGFVIYGTDMNNDYAVGDILSGTAVSCTLKKYNGFAELINLNAEDLTITSGGTVSTANVAMADLAGVNTGALVHYEGLICSVNNNKYYLTDGTTTLQVYNAIYAFEALEDGETYNITGVYQQYNNTKEILPRSAADIEEVVVVEPSVTVTPNTISAPFAGAEGTLALTYENIEEFISFDYYFCDANGNQLEDTDPDYPGDWIYAEINDENDAYTLSYIIDANDGAARTAYMKVYTFDDNLEEVYAIVTVNQAQYVVDYATLPFEYDGNGTGDLPNGFTVSGLGTYNSSPAMKFDGTGDYAILKFNERPGTLTFDIKGNAFSGSTFTVQISEDGVTYTDLETYTELGDTQHESFDNLGENVRYIKWVYTYKSSGNVALGNIVLAEYVAPALVASITVNPDEVNEDAEEHDGTLALTYENLTITDMDDFDIQYCDAEGEETTQPDWIEVLVAEQDPEIGEGYVVSYYMVENEGPDARTAYFKVYAMDDETNLVYSNLVTISQAAPVAPVTGDKYVKVTSTADLTSGQYLIVYAKVSVAFDGSLETLDAASNTIEVILNDDEIDITSETAAAEFTIDITAGTIKSASGYYIGQTSDANGLASSTTTAYTNTISFDEDGNANIVSGGAYLRYNIASNQTRFRYYKSSSYTNQKAIQLYKKVENTPAEYTLAIDGYGNSDGGYYLIASPVTVDPSTVGMTTGEYDLYSFNQAEDDEWRNYKAGAFTSLEPGKGYLYAHKTGGEFTLTGTAYTGNGTIELVYDDAAIDFKGWNLVGNPWGEKAYPDHAFYTMAEGGADIDVTPNVAGTEVAAMTGIFVVAESENETVTFSKTATGKSANLALNITNSSKLVDRAIVRFGEGRQLPKFQLRDNSTKIYFEQSNKDYAIVNAEEIGEMPVSFKAENNGTYTFSVNTENVEMEYLHLIDNMTGADIDLIANPSYSFEAKVTDYASRFRLVFSANSSINEQNANNFAFFNGNDWTINNEGEATLQVVDMTGRVLSTETVNGNATTKVNAATGVYMLRLINGNNIKTQKVVVK